jgi:hypothetical protein
MKRVSIFLFSAALVAQPFSDPYASLSPVDKGLLKPAVERWVHDQVKHDWPDLWSLQDQTSELKNELLLGRRDAPDMSQKQYVEAMKATIGTGYPEIKAFTLREVRRDNGGFRISGCGKLQREAWKQTNITEVHVTLVNGKPMFGLPKGTPELCRV